MPVESVSVAPKSNANVVGSEAWNAAKSANTEPKEKPDCLAVGGKCPGAVWVWKADFQTHALAAMLQKFSLTAAAVYRGEEELFAVACNTLQVEGTIRCEGVTIFPPGSSWISLGLHCIGIDPAVYSIDQDTDTFSDERFELALEIKEMAALDQLESILKDNKLIQYVDMLFSAWLQDDEEDDLFIDKSANGVNVYECTRCGTSCHSSLACERHASECSSQKVEDSESESVDDSSSSTVSDSFDENDQDSVSLTPSNNKSRTFVCGCLPQCSSSFKKRSFRTAEGLRKHIRVMHLSDSTDEDCDHLFSCRDCLDNENLVVGFQSASALYAHMEVKHNTTVSAAAKENDEVFVGAGNDSTDDICEAMSSVNISDYHYISVEEAS